MSEERARILQMISEGKVTAKEGAKLLSALREATSPQPPSEKSSRWFRVRVTDMETGRTKVNVNLPLRLISVATKMGARFAPKIVTCWGWLSKSCGVKLLGCDDTIWPAHCGCALATGNFRARLGTTPCRPYLT